MTADLLARFLLRSRKGIAAGLLLIFLSLPVLAGCSALGGKSSAANSNPGQPTITLTATADNLGYQATAPQACPAADFASMQTDRPQGNLMSWQPGSHRLAYVSSQLSTGWYLGGLNFVQEPNDAHPQKISDTLQVTGDLTWSPDGQKLAFLAYRLNEGVETVMMINADGSKLVDFFPRDVARGDKGASQKSIVKWQDTTHLSVFASCGEDCQQAYQVNITDASVTPEGAQQRKNSNTALNRAGNKWLDGLMPDINLQTYDPKTYPRGFSAPNWSPDNRQVLYLDRHGILWLLDPTSKKQSIVDVGLRTVDQTQWSSDSKRVAVHAEDRIFVFEVPCESKEP